MRRREAVAAAGAAAAYGLGLAALTRGVTVEHWDGVVNLGNAVLLVRGPTPGGPSFNSLRPALDWLLLVPAALARARPAAVHLEMSLIAAAALWWTYRWLRRLAAPAWAAAGTALVAAQPIWTRFAPFALFDIAAVIPFLAFLEAALLLCERPTRPNGLRAAALFSLAVAARYQLCLALAAPALYLALRRRPAPRRAWVWLAACPAAAAAFVLPLNAALAAAAGPRGAGWANALGGPALVLAYASGKAVYADALVYARSLADELGWGLCALAVAGGWAALRRRRDGAPLMTVVAAVAFVALLSAVPTRERRYAIPVSPLVCGLGVWAGARGLGLRRTDALGALLLAAAFFPWSRAASMAWHVARGPEFHPALPPGPCEPPGLRSLGPGLDYEQSVAAFDPRQPWASYQAARRSSESPSAACEPSSNQDSEPVSRRQSKPGRR